MHFPLIQKPPQVATTKSVVICSNRTDNSRKADSHDDVCTPVAGWIRWSACLQVRQLNEQTNHTLVLVCEVVDERANPVTEGKTC